MILCYFGLSIVHGKPLNLIGCSMILMLLKLLRFNNAYSIIIVCVLWNINTAHLFQFP